MESIIGIWSRLSLFILLFSSSQAAVVNGKLSALSDAPSKIVLDLLKAYPSMGQSVVFAMVKTSSIDGDEIIHLSSCPLSAGLYLSKDSLLESSLTLTPVDARNPQLGLELNLMHSSTKQPFLQGAHSTQIRVAPDAEEYLSVSYIRRSDCIYTLYLFTLIQGVDPTDKKQVANGNR